MLLLWNCIINVFLCVSKYVFAYSLRLFTYYWLYFESLKFGFTFSMHFQSLHFPLMHVFLVVPTHRGKQRGCLVTAWVITNIHSTVNCVETEDFLAATTAEAAGCSGWFLPRDAMLSAVYATAIPSVRPSVCLSVRPSVRPSVTRVDQSKTVEAKIMQFSPYSSPIPLVFDR